VLVPATVQSRLVRIQSATTTTTPSATGRRRSRPATRWPGRTAPAASSVPDKWAHPVALRNPVIRRIVLSVAKIMCAKKVRNVMILIVEISNWFSML